MQVLKAKGKNRNMMSSKIRASVTLQNSILPLIFVDLSSDRQEINIFQKDHYVLLLFIPNSGTILAKINFIAKRNFFKK